ncbi:dihydrodipicolinate synthase family protein [Bosea sp. BK604]|uniref:dihydrodipicolinate synthase family protein n=1 Tax=Bosea sp. BK604 TaxID=2512180 RepID=UPI001048BB10|nr:dihydrodipicolinate synthase family protein [Bosea sp. BK604]TCR65582.1 dihydrodipicolinate synthase/N-acetylneuraminate lyase [Bosea sp. BK604]
MGGKLGRAGRWGKLRGNWATLLLPIEPDGAIDLSRLADEIDILIAARVDGIYSNGTAGECHNQTEAEFDAIQRVLAERCSRAKTPFVIGACQPDPSVALDRLRRAVAHAPDGIQVILPDWWPVTDPEAVDFLQMAAELTGDIPLVLYNPPHAKRVLSPATLAAVLKQVPQVVGIKLADGDADWYAQARAHLDDWALYLPGHHLATGVQAGVAAGAFSNVACLNPRGAQSWTDMMRTDLAGAREIERRICAFMDEHILPFRRDQGYSNAALDKLLAAIGDWAPVGPRLRRPYRWIDGAEAERLRPIARRMMPEIMDAR